MFSRRRRDRFSSIHYCIMIKRSVIILLLSIPVIAGAQGYTLQQCTEMALKNSYELKNSQLDQQIADQTKKELFTKFFPSVSASGATFRADEYLVNGSIDLSSLAPLLGALGINPAVLAGMPLSMPVEMVRNGTIGMVTAVQPVFTGGQIYYGNKLAGVGREVSVLKGALTENEIVSKTEEYYWQIVSLKEKKRTVDTAMIQLDGIEKAVTAAVEAGLAKRSDLLRIELERQNTESNRIKIENGIKILSLLLCNLTGAPADGFDIEMSGFPEVKAPLGYYIDPAEALAARTESQLLGKSIEAASLQHKLEVGKHLPTVAAGAGYIYHNLLDKDEYPGMVFATVSIPVSSWWEGSYAIRRSRLGEMKADNTRTDMLQKLAVDIESKWNNLQESYLQAEIAGKSIESAEENLSISRDFYDAGTLPLTDLLSARTQLQMSHNQYTDACTDYYLKLSSYLRATGR